jgi:hypothetical protein
MAALRAVLPPSASLKATKVDDKTAIVRVGTSRLTARWVGRGGLREVRDVIGISPRPDLIVGSSLSLAARAEASRHGIGWVDESGAAEIVTKNIVVARSGEMPHRATTPDRWTSVVAGVAEALLCGVTATTAATADETGYSNSSTATALSVLTDFGLLEASAGRGPNSGRRVRDRDQLLKEYAEAAPLLRPKVELRCGVLWREPFVLLEELGERWDDAGVQWAATGAMGAAVLAPHLTDVGEGEIYVDAVSQPELRNVAASVGIEPMVGGRLVLRPFPTLASRRLATEEDGIRLAPWPRVYADLRQIGVRGEDAAEHLRETMNA